MELIEDIHMNSIRSKNVSSDLSELRAVVTAIKRDAYTQRAFDVCLHIVCKTLCRHTYCILVHTVCADSHDSAKSASAEFKIAVECVLKFCHVSFLEGENLRLGSFIEISVQPTLNGLHKIVFHNIFTFCFICSFRRVSQTPLLPDILPFLIHRTDVLYSESFLRLSARTHEDPHQGKARCPSVKDGDRWHDVS